MNIAETLDERGRKYGTYIGLATIAQDLKQVARSGANYHLLDPDMAESLDMIFNKVARIVNGCPFYRDSWHDIVGYAELVNTRLGKME
jgi:hypothetical protein